MSVTSNPSDETSTGQPSARFLKFRKYAFGLLAVYSLLLFVFALWYLDGKIPNDVRLMSSRLVEIEASLNVLKQGGPALLGLGGKGSAEADQLASGRSAAADYVPLGLSDDQGIYFYVPVLANAFGADDPKLVLKWFFISLYALLILVYPLVFYSLFESIPFALFIPLPLLFKFDFIWNTDIYWVSAWILLLAFPFLFLLSKRQIQRETLLVLSLLMILASFASSVRIHAGLPVLLAALLLVLTKEKNWFRRGGFVVLLLAFYTSIHIFGFDLIRSYRDWVIGRPGMSDGLPVQHPFWHNAYIGLGYLKNGYGIDWNDAVANEHVRRVNPGARYLSPEYEATLRTLYLNILKTDPGFVLKGLGAKLLVVFTDTQRTFGPLIVFSPFIFLIGRRRKEIRNYGILLLPAFMVSVLPPLLTIPRGGYELGWLGAAGLVWLLVLGWLFVQVPALVSTLAANPGKATLLLERFLGWKHCWLAAGLAFALATVGWVVSRDIKARSQYLALQSPLSSELPPGGIVLQWDLLHGIPADWGHLRGTRITAQEDGVAIRTNRSRSSYQIWSPDVELAPGIYEVRIAGAVLAGGLELGVLDVPSDKWTVTAHFWSGQREDFANSEMAANFTVAGKKAIRIILSNFSPKSGSSFWNLRRVTLYRLDHGDKEPAR